MIIIDEKDGVQTVYFNKNIYKFVSDDYVLVLSNRGSNKEYVFNVTDTHMITQQYYTFDIDFSDVQNDEYEYTLTDADNNIVVTGLIRIGELTYRSNIYVDKNTDCIIYEPK